MDNSWEHHQHPSSLNLEQEYAFDPDYIGFPTNWRSNPAQSQQFQQPFHQPPYFNSVDTQDQGFQHSQHGFDVQDQRGVDTTRIPPGNSYLQTSTTVRNQSGYPVRDSGPLQSSLISPAYPEAAHTQSRQYASGSQQALNLPQDTIKHLPIGNDSPSPVFPQDPSLHFEQPQNFIPQPNRDPSPSQRQYNNSMTYLQLPSSGPHVRSKRGRVQEDPFVSHDSRGEEEYDPPTKEELRTKLGACARCKSLKVKCEFRDDPETCRRCLNGRHTCIIPGRKKRRVPPKREDLLNQIRAQAAEITRLMADLNIANQRAGTTEHSPESENASVSDLGSVMLETDFKGDVKNPTDQQDWLARAWESIEEFGGYIAVGTASGTRRLIEDSDSDQSDLDGEISSEYESAMGDTDSGVWDPDDVVRKREGASDMLATVPSQVSPFGLIANLSWKKTRIARAFSAEVENKDEVGVAREDYFRATTPDPTQRVKVPQDHQHPQIFTRGIVTPDEVENLFGIYFDNMNVSVSLLDPVLYTAKNTFYRSPFLFTVICAIASRHFKSRPGLYPAAMRYARQAGGTALISGQKNIEMVQAYILLSLYPTPVKRWEEDRSWLYLGLAIRVAIDLNLHIRSTVKPKNEFHARELLNRTRVWINCFNVDRSTGSQYGKSPTIPNTDYIGNHSRDWWCSSPYNMKNFDVHTCAYNAELRLIGQFRAQIYSDPEHPTGLNKEIDFEQLASQTDDQLADLKSHWLQVLEQNTDPQDRHSRFRTGLINLAYSYARMVSLSHGFQRLSGKHNLDENPFIHRCWSAATDVCLVVVDTLYTPDLRIFLRHGVEAQSVFVTFAATFLIKLLDLKYATCFSSEQRQGMHDLVQRVINVLGSPEISVDDQHAPRLYSRLLQGLLDIAKIDTSTLKYQRKSKSQSPRDPSSMSPAAFPEEPSSGLMNAKSVPNPVSSVMSPDPFDFAVQSDQYISNSAYGVRNGTGMNVPEFFMPPLPLDNEMLHSVHSLTNSYEFGGMVLPGLNWMGQLQDTDAEMKECISESMMYYPDTQQFIGT